MNGTWNDPELIIAFVGSFVSVVSIIVNIFQWLTNKSFKKTMKMVLEGTNNAFTSILTQSNAMNDNYPSEHDRLLASIIAHAERGKDQIKNVINSILK